jgi:hypothetical protein
VGLRRAPGYYKYWCVPLPSPPPSDADAVGTPRFAVKFVCSFLCTTKRFFGVKAGVVTVRDGFLQCVSVRKASEDAVL